MSRDLRQYAGQTNIRLLIGFVLLLFLVGDGLIYLIWGPGAATLGALCLMSGLLPLGLIWLALLGVDWLARRAKDD